MDLRKAVDEAETLKNKMSDRSYAPISDNIMGSDAQRQIEMLLR